MKNDPHKKVLDGQNKPTAEQTAWVFSHLRDHLHKPGSFRVLIYKRMGYTENDYSTLFNGGGMAITNAFIDLEELL